MSIGLARLAAAVLASVGVILGAPFLGQIRGVIRSTFPGAFVPIVGGALALAVIGVFAAAVAKVRDRRRLRFAAIAASVGGAAIYSVLVRTGVPEVDVVERVHLVEYGAIALLFYRVWRSVGDASSFVLPMLAGLLVATLDEWLQWFVPDRVGEAHDVLLDLVAVGCGLVFAAALDPPVSFRARVHGRARPLVAAAFVMVTLVFGAFVGSVHLGYLVTDPQIGAFKSSYTAEALRRLSSQRRESWQHDPPVAFHPLSREDQYLGEGLWHVRKRNERWMAGDFIAAWRENQILEAYFAPVLDTVSYAARSPSRWSTDQKTAAEQRVPGAPTTSYLSQAEPYPILVWSRPMYWLALGVLAFAAATWGSLGTRRVSDLSPSTSR
jgi:hypothetical protein